jgi:hypothetical protein
MAHASVRICCRAWALSWAEGGEEVHGVIIVHGELPLALEEMLASTDADVVRLARQIAVLPSPDPLCLYCVTLSALPLPEFAALKLCREHLAVFRALQCKGWNKDRCHQRVAGLARHGRLKELVQWWPNERGEQRERGNEGR